MKPGDIVFIRFPQVNLTTGKLRPALVLADTPGRFDDILIALVSSQIHQAVPEFDVIVDESDPDFAESRLKVPSVVRTGRLATVDKELVEGRLGRISGERLERIKTCLAEWLLSEADSPEA